MPIIQNTPTPLSIPQLQEIPELRILIEIRDYEMRKIKDPAKEISVNDFLIALSE
jgi:hypothetical protein